MRWPISSSLPNRPHRRERVIESADEFIRLRTSDLKDEYDRAAHEEARWRCGGSSFASIQR